MHFCFTASLSHTHGSRVPAAAIWNKFWWFCTSEWKEQKNFALLIELGTMLYQWLFFVAISQRCINLEMYYFKPGCLWLFAWQDILCLVLLLCVYHKYSSIPIFIKTFLLFLILFLYGLLVFRLEQVASLRFLQEHWPLTHFLIFYSTHCR